MGHLLYLMFRCDGKFRKFGNFVGVNTAIAEAEKNVSEFTGAGIGAALRLKPYNRFLSCPTSNQSTVVLGFVRSSLGSLR